MDEIRHTYPDQTQRICVIGNKPRDIIRGNTIDARLFVACNVDCFDPPKYFIIADTWEEAYELACDELETIRIDADNAHDIEDYGLNTDEPRCSFTSDGKPIDTEALHVDAVRILSIELA